MVAWKGSYLSTVFSSPSGMRVWSGSGRNGLGGGGGLDRRVAAREGSYLGIIKLLFGHRLVQY